MKKIVLSIFIIIFIPIVLFLGFYIYAIYFHETNPATKAYLAEKDPIKKMDLLENIMDENVYNRWAWLDDAAELAYDIKHYKKAKTYSLESLELSSNYKNDWNYGNSIHNSNIILGRISLINGDKEKAKKYLLDSAKSKGSPQLDTFGPNLNLANDLLKSGEKETVLIYLKSISSFWKMDNGCINKWITQIKDNQKPELCNCDCK